jgi:hypothetical protein
MTTKKISDLPVVSSFFDGTEFLLGIQDQNTVQFPLGILGNTSVSGSFSRNAPVTKTSDFTITPNENWIIVNNINDTCVVTLPNPSDFIGRELMFLNYQYTNIVSSVFNVMSLSGDNLSNIILSASIGSHCTLVSDGSNWITMNGN